MTHQEAKDAMVGWPARWDPGVGRDQHHHPTVTDEVPVDQPILPLSTPTHPPSHTHSHVSHTHSEESPPNKRYSPPSPQNSGPKNGSLKEGPISVERDFICIHTTPEPPPPSLSPYSESNHCHKNHSDLVELVTPSCSSTGLLKEGILGSRLQPSSLSGFDGSQSSSSLSCVDASGKTLTDHSYLSHSPTPVATSPASLNGTSSRGPPDLQPANHGGCISWSEIEETSPLTTTNGEVGRQKINGVAIMRAKDRTVTEGMGEEAGEEEEEEEEEGEEEEMKCGLGKWCSPPWAQRLANKQMFLMVFCLTSVLQGMFYTYFVSVLTTIEKLFQLKSKTTGIIMSATEMGQIGGALLLTYYGGQGHRPKWIGWGIVLFAFCALLCSLPHFLFGPELLQKHLELTPSQDNPLDNANTCKYSESAPSLSTLVPMGGGVLEGETNNWTLSESVIDESLCESRDSFSVLAIFFLSLLGVGIGQTAAYNLGIPYIDDNVANRETPIYFAGTSGVRILGPTLGFVLGSVCTRLYVDPLTDPGITTSDPRWIGAWWLGLVFVSVALFLTSIAMFAFPRRMPSSPKPVRTVFQSQQRNPSLKDFPKAVKRLLKNNILLLRTASSVLHILPIAGLYTFLPKYLESQFRLPVHTAAMVSGIGGILVMGLGIFASGVFIRRAKPSARAVAGWIAVTALVYSIGMIILMFVGCSPDDLVGIVEDESGKHFSPQCERTCGNCDNTMYAPVCDSHEKTHFSACHIGCSNATHVMGSNKLVFSNCECLEEGVTAELRLCELQCGNFVWYVIIFSFFVLIHSTSEVGGMLVTLRCVDPKDKAMALGLISVAIGLFGNVPCPIIYGAVVDSACIQWKERCKELGACQLYDSDIFRMFFHGITGAVMLLAFIVDVVVWHKAKSVSFTEDDEGPEEAAPMNPKSLSPSPSTPVAAEQTPTTSTAQEISPVCSTSGGEPSISHEEDQSESCV